MPPHTPPAAENQQLSVLIVDEHEVSRAACTALLRTEGMNVVADVALACEGIAAARALDPQVVIVDAAPGNGDVFETVRRLRALPSAPTVVLTSSADRTRLHPLVDHFPFVAKADICTQAILRAIGLGRDEIRYETRS